MSNITYFYSVQTADLMETDHQQKILLLTATDTGNFPPDYTSRFHSHIYCQHGSANFLYNGRSFECKSGDFIFLLADNEITEFAFSNNFKATVLFVEKEFLTNNFPSLNTGIDAIIHHRINPMLHPDKKDKERILENFSSLYRKSLEVSNRFYDEILDLQMQLFILEMWDIFIDQLERRKRTLQSGTLYERFLQLVEENCMTEREVKFYSNKLNITPKYLNQVCKLNTGITASHWIQRYAKERIMLLLDNKNMNISEIANEMGFSSYSFFTRYVKKLIGLTPSEYRLQL